MPAGCWLYLSVRRPSSDDVLTPVKMAETGDMERDTLDFIDLLEDPDELPPYTGCCDFSSF